MLVLVIYWRFRYLSLSVHRIFSYTVSAVSVITRKHAIRTFSVAVCFMF